MSHDTGLSKSNSKKASSQLCLASCHVDGESSYKLVHKKSSLKLLDEEHDIGLKNFNFPKIVVLVEVIVVCSITAISSRQAENSRKFIGRMLLDPELFQRTMQFAQGRESTQKFISFLTSYGMVAANTRPLFVDPENTGYWFSTYRQYCGLNTTHGQLGGAFSEDGQDWATYANLNSNGSPPWGGGGVGGTGVSQARYPSAVGTEDIPIAMWTEYSGITTNGSLYGGIPYYTYDEFGWDGGSFAYPLDTDLLWNQDAKDLWVGSVSISYDDDLGMPVINAVFKLHSPYFWIILAKPSTCPSQTLIQRGVLMVRKKF